MAGYMQFWGIEVKAKQPCQVSLEPGSMVHISQATLGELKKDDETVTIHVKIGEKKLVMARLSKNTPQMSFDLVFNEDFEISHSLKNGSIHLMGYQSESLEIESDDFSDEEEDDVPIAHENAAVVAPAVKPKAADKSKTDVKDEVDEDDSSDDSEFDADDSGEDSEGSEEDGTSVSSEGDDEDGSDESEEETPVKVADVGKKRPNGDAKTPPESKKAKMATPQKTDGKKAAQPTTPVSSKKGAKTPAGDKTPKSGGSEVSCGSCKKSFKSAPALESHNKAKHGAK